MVRDADIPQFHPDFIDIQIGFENQMGKKSYFNIS